MTPTLLKKGEEDPKPLGKRNKGSPGSHQDAQAYGGDTFKPKQILKKIKTPTLNRGFGMRRDMEQNTDVPVARYHAPSQRGRMLAT
jgi:hypothetical protein